MHRAISSAQNKALIRTLRAAYIEIFPTATVESRLNTLPLGSYVAVTCSPVTGVAETLAITERLADRGFKVIPHIAAKMVSDKAHLRKIMARLKKLPIAGIFVPGGDAAQPAGDYSNALDLLRDIADLDHGLTEIGIAAHPEGHPEIEEARLVEALLAKQPYANYLVTQMCFDADVIGAWVSRVRERGVTLPVWLGLPSVANRKSLMTTSLRIGVGNSLRYLTKHRKIAARLFTSKDYRPDSLLFDLAPHLANRELGIEGHHIYCFNEVERAQQWRADFLADLEAQD